MTEVLGSVLHSAGANSDVTPGDGKGKSEPSDTLVAEETAETTRECHSSSAQYNMHMRSC